MDNLLKNEFIDYHYNQHHASIKTTLSSTRSASKIEKHNTNVLYFEISDVGGNLVLNPNKSTGTSRYNNSNGYSIAVINYDKFLTSLPNPIQRGKQRCDIIIFPIKPKTDFLLVEIKESSSSSSKTKANRQLLDTLAMLIAVPGIKTFIDAFQIKQCCRFIKKAPDPYPVIAPLAFTRQERLSSDGSKLSNPEIEKYGFELYRYSDTQSYTFN